jgi:hypothetical protein
MPDPSAGPPDIREIDAITAIADPVLRNLRITQCYFELSRAMAERVGAGANWCTFATWASKQAGQTIRGEDLSRSLDAIESQNAEAAHALHEIARFARSVGRSPGIEQIRRTLWRVANPAAALARASDAVARGNLKVFAEIGRAFAGFLGADLALQQETDAALAEFLETLRDGDPPDGQRYLRNAFAHYHSARSRDDACELLLLANVEIGFHEQTRLQPEIRQALEAALPDAATVTHALLSELLPNRLSWVRLRMKLRMLFGRQTPLEAIVAHWLSVVQREVRRLVTEHLMVLEMPPAVRLRLGQDLRAAFPPALSTLTHPELVALLARIDPTPDSLAESGAADWGDLADRIHFIADLFRCFHTETSLWDAPFTMTQVAEMKAGQRPTGRL